MKADDQERHHIRLGSACLALELRFIGSGQVHYDLASLSAIG